MENSISLIKDLNLWLEKNEYKGIDPFQLDEKAFKLGKYFPFIRALRKLLKPFHPFIPKSIFTSSQVLYYPKAIGLIIGANSLMFRLTKDQKYSVSNPHLFQILKDLRSPGFQHHCWGLPFEWGQHPRYPKDTPFVCVTCPIGHGLLDYYETFQDYEAFELCKSIAKYLIEENGCDDLGNGQISLYYSPLDRKYAYNSDIMAASFLYRLLQHDPHESYRHFADKLIRFVLTAQNADGSWNYADKRGQQEIATIDNRHTGFVLEALSVLHKVTHDPMLYDHLQKGKTFYLENLFNQNIPKWSPKQTYPVDIHDVAQAIITLAELGEFEKAQQTTFFAIKNMFNGKDEFYYKYFENGGVNKTVFIRWGQAWMYRALAKFFYDTHK